MRPINFKKHILPHALIIAGFLLIVSIYFMPMFQGKVLQQTDVMQFKGMSREIVDFREKTGEEALWTNTMFSGMPAYMISVVYPGNLSAKIASTLMLSLPKEAGIVFLYCLSFYIMLLCFGVPFGLAGIGAIAYAFSSYFLIIFEPGHITKALALAYAPLIFAGIQLVLSKRLWLGFSLTALGVSMEIMANHYQMTYYLLFIILFWLIAETILAFKNKVIVEFSKKMAILAAAAIIGIGTNAASLWTTYEYADYSIRGKSELSSSANASGGLDKDYAFNWSYGIDESFTLLIPNFMGGSSNSTLDKSSNTAEALKNNGVGATQSKSFLRNVPTYWGTQPGTSGPVYVGAIICLLFVLGIFIVKNSLRWWILGVTVLALMLSWGKNFEGFNMFFFDYFPMYNKFRSVASILIIVELTMPLLAILALKEIMDKKLAKETILKHLKWSFIITAGLCLFFALAGGVFYNFTSAGDEQLLKMIPQWLLDAILLDRASLLRSDAIRSFIFIVLAAGLIWLFIKDKLKSGYMIAGIGLLIAIDLISVDQRYLNNESFVTKSSLSNTYNPSQADQAILQDKDLGFRVINTTKYPFTDAYTSYLHNSIGGYNPARIRRYQDLIDSQLNKNNMSVYNMLNTRYFIVQDQQSQQTFPQRNPGALGNAWFVKGFVSVKNADEELAALTKFNPKDTAIIDQRFIAGLSDFDPTIDSSDKITLKLYDPNHLVYESNTSAPRLTVFSEVYYDKGWLAFIDGKVTTHVRANYILRSMVIPAGKHTVEFKFEPHSYYTGNKIAMAASIIMILGLISGLFMELRAPKQ